MNANEVINMMDAKYALFGLFFAFNNRLQTVGDMFYEEITCKQFFLLACMNLYTEEAPTTKKCPYCKSEIDIEATKCPNCTSDISEVED